MNEQTIQQIQPRYTSNPNTNANQADILLQNNIPSCSNKDGGLCGDGFSWYSDEDIENEQERDKRNYNRVLFSGIYRHVGRC
jgi:hypothetical protein